MSQNNPEPLDHTRPCLYHLSGTPRIIAGTWKALVRRMGERKACAEEIGNATAAFAAGLYAASAAITLERADARAISEAAFRVEQE